MKYMLMMHGAPGFDTIDTWSPEDFAAHIQFMHDFNAKLTSNGEWVGGEGLAHPSQAKTIRVRDGVPAITDGPFVEAKEQFAGYCLFDCETPERAQEIAARWPDARYAAVELRPVMEPSGTEM
jgi:hypothetical protein